MPNATIEFESAPLGFLNKYIMVDMGRVAGEFVVKNMAVIKEDDCFYLRERDPRKESSVPFYLLNWGKGRTFVGRLGWSARYFFTGPFSGCSFGMAGSWMFPTVAHSNIEYKGGREFESAGMNVKAMDKGIRKGLASLGFVHVDGEAGITVIKSGSADRSRPERFFIFGWRWYGFWYFYQVDGEKGFKASRVKKLQ